jgi:hypothetical protein
VALFQLFPSWFQSLEVRQAKATGVVIGNSTDIDRVQVQWDDTGEVTHCPKANLELVLHA